HTSFSKHPATTQTYTLSLHDALPISILMASTTRQLGGSGIRIFNQDYESPLLRDLYRRDGPGKVTVKSNPFDIGYILVLDEKNRSEEHTSELQSRENLVCRLLLEKKK